MAKKKKILNQNIMNMQYVTKTLINDEIKLLPSFSNALELIPAPGTGKIILVISAVISQNFVSYYTDVSDQNSLVLAYGNWEADASNNTFITGDGIDTSVLQRLSIVGGASLFESQRTSYVGYVGDNGYHKSAYENQPITILVNNHGRGNFSGGDPANTLKVTVYYVVVDL